MRPELKNIILQWFAKADEDLHGAEKLYHGDPLPYLGIIGFHCQQCVEKYLKAFLLYKEFEFKKIHDLETLAKHCIIFDKDFADLEFKNLTDYAVDFRYFMDEYEPDIEEIEYFMDIANKTKNLVKGKIVFE